MDVLHFWRTRTVINTTVYIRWTSTFKVGFSQTPGKMNREQSHELKQTSTHIATCGKTVTFTFNYPSKERLRTTQNVVAVGPFLGRRACGNAVVGFVRGSEPSSSVSLQPRTEALVEHLLAQGATRARPRGSRRSIELTV